MNVLIIMFFNLLYDFNQLGNKKKHLSSVWKSVSGERGRRLINRSWLVRNFLKFWESSIKEILYWKLKFNFKKVFFTFLIIISMRSPRLESAWPTTVWSILPILFLCKNLRLTDATHFLIQSDIPEYFFLALCHF